MTKQDRKLYMVTIRVPERIKKRWKLEAIAQNTSVQSLLLSKLGVQNEKVS